MTAFAGLSNLFFRVWQYPLICLISDIYTWRGFVKANIQAAEGSLMHTDCKIAESCGLSYVYCGVSISYDKNDRHIEIIKI